MTRQASAKQVDFIRQLYAKKDTTSLRDEQHEWVRDFLSGAKMTTMEGAGRVIDKLMDLPEPTIESGMYKDDDGNIFKVQIAVHGSGKPYAKALKQQGDSFTFEYAPGALRRLRPDNKMSLAEAREFGHLYGVCCVCGRTLTNESSIENGIGPICAERF